VEEAVVVAVVAVAVEAGKIEMYNLQGRLISQTNIRMPLNLN
jgi:hypothetical protein